MSITEWVVYFIVSVPSMYFLYKVLSAAYYYIKNDDSDVLEG